LVLKYQFLEGAIPAMHCNLLLLKEKSKRISVSIGAREVVFQKKFSLIYSLRELCDPKKEVWRYVAEFLEKKALLYEVHKNSIS
jgi:hypothetical protein